MTPKIEIELFDGTVFKLQLPLVRRRLAILVSGGLDSAVLYYVVKYLSTQSENYTVIPYTIDRNSSSKTHAQSVIDYVHNQLNCDRQDISDIPVISSETSAQLAEATNKIVNGIINLVYIGYIKILPQHALHGVSAPFVPVDTELVKHPLKDLTKAHVVDLAVKLGIEKIFEITHSCVYDIDGRCNVCNRCNERAWAFNQLSLTDPGIK